MATLKEHQAAMVDLLANGSGIPASASRLAHAMHDVLSLLASGGYILNQSATVIGEQGSLAIQIKNLIDEPANPTPALKELMNRRKETTPGLNDKALSKREKALKTDSPAKWPTPAEQRVKELENTIRQLKANNAKLKQEVGEVKCDLELKLSEIRELRRMRGGPLQGHTNSDELLREIAELRQQIADSAPAVDFWNRWSASPPAQAGCRKEDTQECKHEWASLTRADQLECLNCGIIKQ